MLKDLKIVAFGDVHNCHDNTPTFKIGQEIRECFPYGKWASSIDILVLDGDWYDKLMPNNHQDVYLTEISAYYLLRFCKDHDITFLIVDGTPLHDAGQIQKFTHINKESGINADIVLVDEIDIVYLSKFDINVLFVPDRPRTSPDETYQVILDKMQQKRISQIDMAVMHGCFRYQMPEIADDHKHNEDLYHEIVKGPIIIGHIHTHSTHGKIIAPGSFSRLSHGEEEPKGYVEINYFKDGTFKAKFKENKSATIYKTVNVTDLDLETSYRKIQKEVDDIPEFSKVRLVCQQNHPISLDKNFTALKINNLHIHWSIKVKRSDQEVASSKEVFDDNYYYQPLIINQDNLIDLLRNKLSNKGYSGEILAALPEYIENIS